MSLNSILFYDKSFSSIIDYPFWEGQGHIKVISKGENLFEGNIFFLIFEGVVKEWPKLWASPTGEPSKVIFSLCLYFCPVFTNGHRLLC